MRIPFLLIGFGHVARRFAHLLEDMRPTLDARGLSPICVGICTRRHGWAFETTGLDATQAANRVAGGDAVGPASTSTTAHDLIARLGSLGAEVRVMIETTPLEIQSGQPAIGHIETALASGLHAISANKGPVSHAWHTLAAQANAVGRKFLFEGAVMDGIPIFNLVRETMPGVTIQGFRGVVNSTTNHILTAMENGEAFAPALVRMQAEGIAEADPSLDVDGWDAAAKVAAMANVWMDARLTPQDVAREGLCDADTARVIDARARGHRIKLVGRARRHPGDSRRVDARVRLEALDMSDPLAQLDGQANALEIESDVLGRVVVTQGDGGLEKTAYALFTDLMTIADSAARTSQP